jgi:hypothetical protein
VIQLGRLQRGGLVFLAIVMAGCGGSYLQWAKPGASLQQAKQDGVECRQISRQPYDVPVGGGIVGGSDPDVRIWKECLEARGYTVTEQSDSQGSHCVASNATVGTRVKSQDGKMLKVATLYGDSPRCANPATPILADLEEDK